MSSSILTLISTTTYTQEVTFKLDQIDSLYYLTIQIVLQKHILRQHHFRIISLSRIVKSSSMAKSITGKSTKCWSPSRQLKGIIPFTMFYWGILHLPFSPYSGHRDPRTGKHYMIIQGVKDKLLQLNILSTSSLSKFSFLFRSNDLKAACSSSTKNFLDKKLSHNNNHFSNSVSYSLVHDTIV